MYNKTFIGILAGFFAAIIWGLWPVLTRSGVLYEFTPNEIVIIRFLICGILLLPFFIKNKCYKKYSIINSVILTIGAGALYVYVSALGLKYAPAGHLGIVEIGTMLTLSAIFGYFLLNEKKNKVQIIGYFIVFSGMMVINYQSLSITYDENVIFGDFLLVIGGVLWAIYTVFSKKWNISSWDAVSIVSVYSMIIYIPLILIFDYENINLINKPLNELIKQALGQGVLAAILALYLFSLSVQILGASRGSIISAFVPSVAVIGAYFYLSEKPTNLELIGLSLTTIGLLLVIFEKKKINNK